MYSHEEHEETQRNTDIAKVVGLLAFLACPAYPVAAGDDGTFARFQTK